MILDLHRQGLSVTAIARRTGRDPKTVRKYIERGLEPPVYGPRQVGRPSKLAPYLDYLRERVAAFPDLSAVRLTRELRERGYGGAYTAVKRFVAAIRPESHGPKPFEVRFETPPGYQAQVDFARFVTTFTDEPGIIRIVWLFSLVLGHSRHIFARFVMHQDLQTLLRCHMSAFERDRRRADRDPLRPHEDRGDRRGWRWPHHLQPLADRARPALRLPAQSLPALSGKDEGQSRAAVQLHPPGLLPRPHLPQSRRSQRPARTTGSTRSPTSGCTARPSASSRRPLRPSGPNCSRFRRSPFDALLKLERRVSHDGLVSIGGNYYSVPDRTRRVVEVHQLPTMIRILDRGRLVATPSGPGRAPAISGRSRPSPGRGCAGHRATRLIGQPSPSTGSAITSPSARWPSTRRSASDSRCRTGGRS